MDKGFRFDSLCHRYLLSTDDRPFSGILGQTLHPLCPLRHPHSAPLKLSSISTERLRRDIRQHHARIGVSCARRGNARDIPSSLCARQRRDGMPRKRQPHNKTISMQESHAYIVPLDEVIATKKFSKLFRDKILTKYSVAQAHLIAHVLDTFPLSREDGHAVPLPYNVLWKKFPSLYKDGELQQLLDDGIFDRDYFSPSEHKCYYYVAGATLLAWLEEDKREKYIESLLNEPLVRLVDGQRAAALKHLLFDNEGKTIPALNKQALASLTTNIVNYQELDWELNLLAR